MLHRTSDNEYMISHNEVLKEVGKRMKAAGVQDKVPTSEQVLAVAAQLNESREKKLNCSRVNILELTGADMLKSKGRGRGKKAPKEVDFSSLKQKSNK